ncbi:hypothetical protein F511_33487 [Dorcoceras hygrometricum]|uniref:Delphilin-like n=1 Tax=Dorcoceras hygrometricum TaxID=472368 RepID=A0A2Z7BXS1_9LAMI|nr:hypothetical protein F511_33487 [Dorcoceras hygrometricum]
MASAFITNSYQINFESVLMIHDNEGMLNMFKALEASGLRQFLGCESTLYEAVLGHFFETALLQDEDITCAISGKFLTISPSLFTTVFALPSDGITNFSEVPKDIVYDARSLFSHKAWQIEVHGKKKFMKHEFRLLNDILAKAITVKAGFFDSVTVERFQMMTAIQYGLKVNWGKVLFDVLKDMVDRTQKKAKGFAAQIDMMTSAVNTKLSIDRYDDVTSADICKWIPRQDLSTVRNCSFFFFKERSVDRKDFRPKRKVDSNSIVYSFGKDR